jgi:uncharacterized membrane protein
MSSIPQSEVRSAQSIRPKHIVFAVIWMMFAYVLYHNERFLIDSSDASWPHYHNLGWRLLVHGLFGAMALLLIFMQFNDGLRARFLKLHRVCGRIYIAAVFVAGPFGVYLAHLDKAIGYTFSFTLATAVLVTLWMFATAMALWCIRTRRVDQHRQWMTRSVAMALTFLEVRVFEGVTGWGTSPDGDTLVVWTCAALGYPLADAVLQVEDFLRSGGRSRRTEVDGVARSANEAISPPATMT